MPRRTRRAASRKKTRRVQARSRSRLRSYPSRQRGSGGADPELPAHLSADALRSQIQEDEADVWNMLQTQPESPKTPKVFHIVAFHHIKLVTALLRDAARAPDAEESALKKESRAAAEKARAFLDAVVRHVQGQPNQADYERIAADMFAMLQRVEHPASGPRACDMPEPLIQTLASAETDLRHAMENIQNLKQVIETLKQGRGVPGMVQ